MHWLLLCRFVVVRTPTKVDTSRSISLLTFLAKLAEAASSALVYLQQGKEPGRVRSVIPSAGPKTVSGISPEAVLGVVELLVDVDLVPLIFKGQHFPHKVKEQVRNLASGRQNPGQLGLVVTGQAEAAGGDDGNAQAQPDFLAAGRKEPVRILSGAEGGYWCEWRANWVRLTPPTGRWRRCRKAPAWHTRFHRYSAGRSDTSGHLGFSKIHFHLT